MAVMVAMAVTGVTIVIIVTIAILVIIAITAIIVIPATAVIQVIPAIQVIIAIITTIIIITTATISTTSITITTSTMLLGKSLLLIPLMIGTTELILIAAVALLIFGGKKIPELMRGLGQGVRSFKKGMNEDPDDSAAPTVDNEVKLPTENDSTKK